MNGKKKIPENWDMIEAAELQVRELKGDPEAGFHADTLWFDGEGRQLIIPCLYRSRIGKKNEEKFSKSYKQVMLFAQFCPFSGKPLYSKEESK